MIKYNKQIRRLFKRLKAEVIYYHHGVLSATLRIITEKDQFLSEQQKIILQREIVEQRVYLLLDRRFCI